MLASEDDSDALTARRFSLASDIVELVVLTTDDGFLQTLREGVGPSRRLWHVLSPEKISDLLVVGSVGILVLDVQALNHAAVRFVAEIKRKFPDLVLVVAGYRESETELARLISDGSIYRFIHKPMSLARATLFADAAVKRFQNQRRRSVQVAAAPAPMPGAPLRPRRILIGVTGAAVAVAVLVAAGWLGQRRNIEQADVTARTASERSAASTAPPAGPRQTFPAVRSVLMEAQERLLARAKAALDQQRLDEAASTIEAARKTGIATERVAQLATELARARARGQAKAAKAAPAAPRAASDPPASPASAETPASPTVNTPSVSAPAAGPDATTAAVPATDLPAARVPALPEPELRAGAGVPAPAVPAAEHPAPTLPGPPAVTTPAAGAKAASASLTEIPEPETPAPALPAATLPAVPTPAADDIAMP